MKTLVVLPSYNESGNILLLIHAIQGLGPEYYICVIDDSSPDGTAAVLSQAKQKNPTDYTNGFRFYTREAADMLVKRPQKHTGYIYLSESLTHLLAAGFRIETFPIIFRNRMRGTSKTTFSEVRDALIGLLQIAWDYRF